MNCMYAAILSTLIGALLWPINFCVAAAPSTKITQPTYVKGIYLSNSRSTELSYLKKHLREAQTYGINTFVMDVQNRMVLIEHVNLVKEAGIFPIARIVVYEGGFPNNIDPNHINSVMDVVKNATEQGFLEIQLDYIRYADTPLTKKLDLQEKYRNIATILEKAKKITDSAGIYLSADIFGRITLNRNDSIGQNLELFAKYTQTLYPMLYPSHYYQDSFRRNNPYKTIKEGILQSKKRVPNTRIVAYIQGFKWRTQEANLSFVDYIGMQIKGAEVAAANGYVIWNARNDYATSYLAIKKIAKKGNFKKIYTPSE